jgi:hypothetical protein
VLGITLYQFDVDSTERSGSAQWSLPCSYLVLYWLCVFTCLKRWKRFEFGIVSRVVKSVAFPIWSSEKFKTILCLSDYRYDSFSCLLSIKSTKWTASLWWHIWVLILEEKRTDRKAWLDKT